MTRRFFRIGSALSLLAAAMAVVGCESSSDGSGGSPDGNSTVQGTVISYSGATAFFTPVAPRGWLARIGDLLAPPALAAGRAGVNVRVSGTGLDATTDGNGFFVLSGVPAGSQTLDFSLGTDSATYVLFVPENATISLNAIVVSDGAVRPGSTHTVLHTNTPAS